MTGVLTLTDYTEGADLKDSNISGFSFTYDGNTVSLADFWDVEGQIDGAKFEVGFRGWDYPDSTWTFFAEGGEGSWGLLQGDGIPLFGFEASLTPAGVAPVPEPATWAMMLIGFGAIGAFMRHRRWAIRTTVSYA